MWVWTDKAEKDWRAKAKAKGYSMNKRRAGTPIAPPGEMVRNDTIGALLERGYIEYIESKAETATKQAEPFKPSVKPPPPIPKVRKRVGSERSRNLTQDDVVERWQVIEACIANGMMSAGEVSAVIGVSPSTLQEFCRKHKDGHINPFGNVRYDGKKLQTAIMRAGWPNIWTFAKSLPSNTNVHYIVAGYSKAGRYSTAKEIADALGIDVKDILKEDD